MQIILEGLANQPLLWAGVVFVLGLLVGSFLNVVIHRLPRMMEREWRAQCAELMGEAPAQEATEEAAQPWNLVVPGSSCPACGHRIRPHENVPVLSWLLLRGRCSACGTRISVRYPLVELATAVLSVVVALRFGVTAEAGFALLVTWALVALAVIDFDTTLLPDSITQPLLWLALVVSLWSTTLGFETLAQSPAAAIVGAAAGYLSLWSVYMLFKLATGKEGMGFGDFKLLAALGAWLGWTALPVIVLLSAVVGAGVGITLIATGRLARENPMPFGPYLAAAGWIAMVYGDAIVRVWLG